MPLTKHDVLAVSREEFAQIQAELNAPYQFHVVERDDQRILFLRTTRDEPDPVSDLETCLDRLPDAAVRDLNHLVLLGSKGTLHLPATIARAPLERRAMLDRAALHFLRTNLSPEYGIALSRVAGDPSNLIRLGLRIPRARCVDMTGEDLRGLAAALGPLLEDGSAKTATIGYLVASDDHVRLSAQEFIDDLAPRWQELRRVRALPPPAAPAPVAAPEPPKVLPKRRPKKTIRVRPDVDLEFNLDATPPEVDYDPVVLDGATKTVEEYLTAHGFDVAKNVEHEGNRFALAAERGVGYPGRVLVRALGRFGRQEADDCLKLVRAMEADLLLVVTENPDLEGTRRTVATKVKVVTPREVVDLRL